MQRRARLVLAAEAIPAVELERFCRELHRAILGQPRQDGVERLLLGDAVGECVIAAEAVELYCWDRLGSDN